MNIQKMKNLNSNMIILKFVKDMKGSEAVCVFKFQYDNT